MEWIVILGWLSLAAVVSTEDCTFPEYLYREDSPWRHRIQYDGESYVFRNIMFNGSTITIQEMKGLVSGNSQIIKATTFTCKEIVDGDKYYVSTANTGPKQSSCFQFAQREENVVQIRKSQAEDSNHKIILCDDSNIELDKWILLQFPGNPSKAEQVCPLEGGFLVIGALGRSSMRLDCFDDIAVEKIENECSKDEGLTFRFTKKCADQFGLYVYNTFRDTDHYFCIANWQSRGSIYLVIMEKSLKEKKMYCLRYSTDYEKKESFDLYVFKGPYCDTSDRITTTRHYIVFKLKKYILNSLCSDENPSCSSKLKKSSCSEKQSDWCGSYCNGCDNNGPWNYMSFDQVFQGEWVKIPTKKKQEVISVEGNTLNVASFLSSKNVQIPFRSLASDIAVYSTVSLQKNGCSPRMFQVKLKNIANSIVTMAVSKAKPTTTYKARQPIKPIPGTGVQTYTSDYEYDQNMILVRHPPSAQKLVDCNFTTSETDFHYTIGLGNTSCSNVKITTETRQIILTTMSDCNDNSKRRELRHFCLHSKWDRINQLKYIVTRSEDEQHNILYYVWYFPVVNGQINTVYWIDAETYIRSAKRLSENDLKNTVQATLNVTLITTSGEQGLGESSLNRIFYLAVVLLLFNV